MADEVAGGSLKNMAEGAPVIRMVNWIISQAAREGASDIHISPETNFVQLRFRIDGKLREVPAPPKSLHLSIVSRIRSSADGHRRWRACPRTRFPSSSTNGDQIRVSTIRPPPGERGAARGRHGRFNYPS
jgi:type IV pilus assembly protein PilB